MKIRESIYKNRQKSFKSTLKSWFRQKKADNYKLQKYLKNFKTTYKNR